MDKQKVSETSLRDFVTGFLNGVAGMPEGGFESSPYVGEREDFGTVTIKGFKRAGTATFEILRTIPSGGYSGIPVYDMFFTDEQIGYVADVAVENL